MNVEEILKPISTKTWCNINDLMKLTELSRSSVLKIRKETLEDRTKFNYGFSTH